MSEDSEEFIVEHWAKVMGSWHSIALDLQRVINDCDDETLLSTFPVTRFILSWMRELKTFQHEFGELFRRRKRPPVADDFTAAVAFSLEQFLSARGLKGCVRCEEKTHRHKNATRPDISVYSNSSLLATVECKTQLGWNRDEWMIDFEVRSEMLQELVPNCATYLCILSEKNWDSSELKKSPNFGKQWFCLSKSEIAKLPKPILHSSILTPIEPMFFQVMERLKTDLTV